MLQVGCEAVADGEQCPRPAKQKNRRKAKDKIKVGRLHKCSYYKFLTCAYILENPGEDERPAQERHERRER